MSDENRRTVEVTRVTQGRYEATNGRGATLIFGSSLDDAFSPVELMLTAIAGCSGIDVDVVTARRAEPTSFRLRMDGDKVRDESGNRLENLTLTFDITFPDGEAGDAARAALPSIVARSHDRLCSVSRTIERGTPVSVEIAPD
jgi:putative redox protein